MAKYKEKELKVLYEPILSDPIKFQQKIDEAFDLLFEEVWKSMQPKNSTNQITKGGDKKYDQSFDRERNRGFQTNSGRAL